MALTAQRLVCPADDSVSQPYFPLQDLVCGNQLTTPLFSAKFWVNVLISVIVKRKKSIFRDTASEISRKCGFLDFTLILINTEILGKVVRPTTARADRKEEVGRFTLLSRRLNSTLGGSTNRVME